MQAADADILPDVSSLPDNIDSLHSAEPASYTMTEDEGDNCRICRGEGTDTQPLFYPCKCSGSIKFVHQDCLMEWLSHSQKKHCELCKTPFRFTKLYDQSMPSTLPLPLFLQQMVIHSIRAASRWTRFVVVGFVWLCWLPWSIRQVWRGLFWLADGSWISENDLREAALAQIAELARSGGDGAADAVGAMSESMNTTLRDSVLKSLPQTIAPVSAFLGLTSGDFLLVKVVRLLAPNLFHWSLNLVSANATDDSLLFMASERQPSLLSGIKLFKSLTGVSILDNAVVDIFEGQLICLLIITAFILVFLIREWVINQQPILNMPDPDRVEEPAAPVQLNDHAALPVRRRRHRLRRALDQPNQVQNLAVENAPRPRAAPAPRRALTEDNMTRPIHAGAWEPTPALPARSASFEPDVPIFDREHSEHEILGEDIILESEAILEVRPPLLPRGAFDEAATIRRKIEEDFENQDGGLRPDLSLLSSTSDVENSDASFLAIPQANPVLTEFTVIHDLPRDTVDDEGANSDFANFGSDLETVDSLELPPIVGTGDDDGVELLSLPQSDSSDGVELTTPVSTDSDSAESASEESIGGLGEEETTSQLLEGDNAQPGGPSVLERIAAWLWQTDGYIPAAAEMPLADDERIVEDLEAEEPFVPVEHPEINVQANLEPVAEPAQPNVQFGIDLNHPDAVDDAEDLDGILELIGVHGPIAGMVQNVIFSEFLITLTIAASVWLPYIWGKITLLILANPVGVFVKAPLYLASRSADVTVDILIFLSGLLGYAFSSCAYAISLALKPLFPSLGSVTRTSHLQHMSWQFAKSSGSRLERVLSLTAFGLKPDLPSFSMQSHHALRVFKQWASSLLSYASSFSVSDTASRSFGSIKSGQLTSYISSGKVVNLPQVLLQELFFVRDTLRARASDLKPLTFSNSDDVNLALTKWSTQDKVIAIFLGYLFFASIGTIYLKVARLVLSVKPEDKLEGVVADSLRQAGGVMKVVIIIGIEMIAFPLYCGLLLDIALLPLFSGVSFGSRIAFMLRAPITGLFVHWFIGTCYMFHFALFVSMCRKIMRKGVLYFIRDPDDPTFHPVRDVLERPVATQLGKIAFSALIYGGLVILCLGGVVWSVSSINGVLPIRWATNEPRLAFPVDVIFYNFMLPFIIRKAEPSKKISAMYESWFRGCASGLRLTHFLFGEEKEEEKGSHVRRTWAALFQQEQGDVKKPMIEEDRRMLAGDWKTDTYFYLDGTYVRAPANDTVRIPKGGKVFVEVNEKNERVDGKLDQDTGMHGKTDERFIKVYIPPNFRARIAAFMFLLWIFAASTGVMFTVGPLLVGRTTIKWLADSTLPPNDLYALTVGLHVCAGVAYAFGYWKVCRDWLKTNAGYYVKNVRQALPQLYAMAKYVVGLVYLGFTFGIVLPLAISFMTEVYLYVPVYSYLNANHKGTGSVESAVDGSSELKSLPATIYILQTWTLGLLYFRLALRVAMNYPCPHTRPALAIRAITRDGWMHPNVKLATRAVVLPASISCVVLLLTPLAFARVLIATLQVTDGTSRANIYLFAYPGLLAAALAVHCVMLLKRQIAGWRVKIRDEVYLIGERLHNFQDVKRSPYGVSVKGKGKQRAVSGDERVEVVT